MLNEKVQDAFNKQINAEIHSSYLYLSMAAYFESQNLKGMASWMRLQVNEELAHGMKFFDFIHDRGGKVVLATVEGPRIDWDSPVEVFENTYEHECLISGMINNLVSLCMDEKDYAAHAFLQWFVTEQVEEEGVAQEIRDKLRLVGDNAVALFMMDQELGKRMAEVTSANETGA